MRHLLALTVCAALAGCSGRAPEAPPAAQEPPPSLGAAAEEAPAVASAAPPEPELGDADALVLALRGEVKVRRADRESPAHLDQRLVRLDALTTGPGALALVVLRSGYAVRLDEDLSLRVGDLALLDAPPATTSLEDQLKEIVDPGEVEPPTSERIVGWQQRLRAGHGTGTIARGEAAKRDDLELRLQPPEKKAKGLRAPAADPKSGAPVPGTPARPSSTDGSAANESKASGGSREEKMLEAATPPAPPPKPIRARDDLPPPPPAGPPRYRLEHDDAWQHGLPRPLTERRGDLTACLRDAARRGRPLVLLLRVTDGAIDRVAVLGAPAPACLEGLLVGARDRALVGSGWLRVELPPE